MGRVTITIDNREYAITCDNGQEGHIMELSRLIDAKAKALVSAAGSINENMLLAMICLLLADELNDIKEKGTAGKQVVSVQNFDIEEVDAETAKVLDRQTDKIRSVISEAKSV